MNKLPTWACVRAAESEDLSGRGSMVTSPLPRCVLTALRSTTLGAGRLPRTA